MRVFLSPVSMRTGSARPESPAYGDQGVAVEGQRHQARARLDQAQAELFGDAVAEVGGTDLGDGQAAGGDHHGAAAHRAAVGVELIRAVAVHADGLDAARLPALHAARLALAQQHLDQVFGRAVAEQLAFVLFVEGDAVLLHQRDEIGRRVARERRAAEVGVGADEVLVRRVRIEVAVGEVGAAAARDADLLGHLLAVVEHQHPAGRAGRPRRRRTGRRRQRR